MGKKKATPTDVLTPVETFAPAHTDAAASTNGKSKKTVCPLSRHQFNSDAKGVVVTIGGQSMVAEPKVFSSGSFGWFVQGSVTVMVGDTPVKAQVGLNVVVANSKDLPK